MKSFITSIKNLFCMDTKNRDQSLNFSGERPDERKLVIPLYQREYKWKDEQIEALLNDIYKRDKFLGTVILDEILPQYEIVDGQQRITTIFLVLAALYNLYRDNTDDQDNVDRILKPYGSFVFINQSIGDFLCLNNREYSIEISPAKDPYNQKTTFEDAFTLIMTHLKSRIGDQTSAIREILDKLLDCEVLLLINNTEKRRNNPIERLFLDINEKGKRLDAEDVFKGYCFQIYDSNDYDKLKELWIDFKQAAIRACTYGFKDVNDLIYRYILLLDEKNKNYNKELKHTQTGIHYLEGKTQAFVKDLLLNMAIYAKSNNTFVDNIESSSYHFQDICKDSFSHRNDHNDHENLRLMCVDILTTGNQIPKLPFMILIYYLSTINELSLSLKHDQMMRIVTNFYIYANLFELAKMKKSKDTIDRTIVGLLQQTEASPEEIIKNVLERSKVLKNDMIDHFQLSDDLKMEHTDFIYSVIDRLALDGAKRTPRFELIYPDNWNFNHEHLVLNDNNLIEWCCNDTKRGVKIKIADIMHWDTTECNSQKKRFSNFIVLDSTLNGEMENRDIIWKIEYIRNWYCQKHVPIPLHIRVYLEHITTLPEYQTLNEYKKQFDWKDAETQIEELQIVYAKFIRAYFRKESLDTLLQILTEIFKNAFSRTSEALSQELEDAQIRHTN